MAIMMASRVAIGLDGGLLIDFTGDRRALALAKQFLELCRRQCRAIKKALNLVAAVAPQEIELFFQLDAFGDNIQAELFRHGKDGCANRSGVCVLVKVFYKRSIDFQCVDGQPIQVAE